MNEAQGHWELALFVSVLQCQMENKSTKNLHGAKVGSQVLCDLPVPLRLEKNYV